jgi:hypothetical protein
MTEAVPYARAQRIRRKLRQRASARSARTRHHWSAMLAFAAGATLVLLTVFVFRPVTLRVREMPSASPVASGRAMAPAASPHRLEVAGSDCESGDGEITPETAMVLRGACLVRGAGVAMQSVAAASLSGDTRAVQLREGQVEFDVDPTFDRAGPFTVETPAVRIEVTGTRFTVAHTSAGGELILHEGSVRVVPHAADATVRRVSAGERLAWVADDDGWRLEPPPPPLSPASPASPPPAGETASEPTPASSVATTRRRDKPSRGDEGNADALIRRVERLREAGNVAEAAATLRAGLGKLARRDREVLSFELGKLLERSEGSSAACEHWGRYAAEFPSGRYADLVATERTRLACE